MNPREKAPHVKAALHGLMAATLFPLAASAAAAPIDQAKLDELTRAIEPRVLEWRRDIHQHPERREYCGDVVSRRGHELQLRTGDCA
jgi:hypothetical protein